MRGKFRHNHELVLLVTTLLLIKAGVGLAVSSQIIRHSNSTDLLKGETKDVIVSSKGTIQIGRAAEILLKDFVDVWSINSVVVSGGTVFVGTSPNGGIFKCSIGKLTKIYPPESEKGKTLKKNKRSSAHTNEKIYNSIIADANTVEDKTYLANEHIFSMATDVAGRLLAGISGDECKLIRFEASNEDGTANTIKSLWEPETLLEPNNVKGNSICDKTRYIFAITLDNNGNIYLGTGPQGKVYKLDPLGKEAQLIYDSRDKNILSLAIGQDNYIYAGSDNRGLIYKINPNTKTATVLYDSDQQEITALLFAENPEGLYAAATSAKVAQAEVNFAEQMPFAGRPEIKPESEEKGNTLETQGGHTLQIANTKEKSNDKPLPKQALSFKGVKPEQVSHIYKITSDGFVTDVFSEAAVFFCLVTQELKLLIGTGNNAQLFNIDPVLEQEAIIYEDKQASQLTAVTVAGEAIYLGTANPAKLIKVNESFAVEGIYTSSLIDAGQPAKWGKLQIDADVPEGCKIMMACRSGNVKDINDPTFSGWSEIVEITEPTQLRCPTGRFCQYKLVLTSSNGHKSPLVREIAVAYTIPNLSPKVKSISISRIEATGKNRLFKISYQIKDDNDDKLIYKIDFRKTGRANWIELADKVETNTFEWDGRTVEDGRYEVRVSASDERSNTPETKLSGSRISETVVVDNTGPVIKKYSISSNKKTITLKLQVSDELSVIGRVDYTIDSNAEWIGTVPNDLVYDTTEEDFTIVAEDIEEGEHIISVKIGDDIGNMIYKTFEIDIPGS